MKKIETLFIRDAAGRCTPSVNPGCEWVLAGEGRATRKWDGTCCAVIGGRFYKRLEWKQEKGDAPASWIHPDFDPAQRSGHGWFPVADGPDDWMHREAWARGTDDRGEPLKDGTYELVGPRIGKNPEHTESLVLVPHGRDALHWTSEPPLTFEALRDLLRGYMAEGIVWHHADGRMVKLKRRDFGFPWPVSPALSKPEAAK